MIEKKNRYEFPKVQNDMDSKSAKKQKQFSQVTQIQLFGIYDLNRHVEVFKNHKFQDMEMLLNLNFDKLQQKDIELNTRLSKMHDMLKMKECIFQTFVEKSKHVLSVYVDKKEKVIKDFRFQALCSFRGDANSLRRLNSINNQNDDWMSPKSVLILFPVKEQPEIEQPQQILHLDDHISSASSFIIDDSSDSDRGDSARKKKITIGKLK